MLVLVLVAMKIFEGCGCCCFRCPFRLDVSSDESSEAGYKNDSFCGFLKINSFASWCHESFDGEHHNLFVS